MQVRLIRIYDSKEVSVSNYHKLPSDFLQSGVYYVTLMGSKGKVQ